MENYNQCFEANRELWNKRTAVHKDSSFYDAAGFIDGKNVLTPIELKELGNVSGKKMLHLQCHFGLDSLNWARLGADVTGIDFSDLAIKEAKQLNDELGLNAKFICCNVYDLLPQNIESSKVSTLGATEQSEGWEHSSLERAFDIVFTSYGVVGWLPDLDKWAEIISYYLKPDGIFYMAEFHPVVWMFDDEFTQIKYFYNNREIIITDNEGTYTDRTADIKAKEYGWNHSLSEVLNSLISHDLRIDQFNEFMYSPYPCFNKMVQGEDGNWRIKDMEGKIPMVYSIRAIRQ